LKLDITASRLERSSYMTWQRRKHFSMFRNGWLN